jgi:F0F1-type ATP synthase assembly protein I
MLAAMEPRPTLNPAGAGMLLLAAMVLCIAVGALIGWAAGSWALGALGGAIVGIPVGVFAVYRRYRGVFS